jgi:hypothetical protein
MNRSKFRIVLPIFLLGATLVACSSAVVPVISLKEKVLAFAEPKVDAELAALASGDYQAFIQDYNETMKQATTEEAFNQLKSLVSTKIGAYISREVASVLQQGDYYIVVYQAKFEKDDPVTIRVVFETGGDHLIAGLWFDSEKLRG